MNTFRAATRRALRDNSNSSVSAEPANSHILNALLQGLEVANDYRVVIFDPSTEDVVQLLGDLKAIGIAAVGFQTKRDFLRFIEKQPINLAVMVLHSKCWWQDELRSFCQSIRYLQEKAEPEILCILSWPPKNTEESTRDRIIGDALRAEVLHES